METDVNHILAVLYGLIGWGVRVVMYYFSYDTEEKFVFSAWWRKFDKYIILGFAGAVVLAILSDLLWESVDQFIVKDGTPFDERWNIFLGFLAVLILMVFDRRATKKADKLSEE